MTPPTHRSALALLALAMAILAACSPQKPRAPSQGTPPAKEPLSERTAHETASQEMLDLQLQVVRVEGRIEGDDQSDVIRTRSKVVVLSPKFPGRTLWIEHNNKARVLQPREWGVAGAHLKVRIPAKALQASEVIPISVVEVVGVQGP